MKILTVVNNLGLGGTERVALTCALGYQDTGVESALLAYLGGGVRESAIRNSGVRLFIGGEDIDDQRNAVAEASGWKPDIVHIHRTGYPDDLSGSVLKELSKNHPKIMETNVFARFDNTKNGDLIDLHIVLSHWCLWKYEQWSRLKKPKPLASVIPNPVDISGFYPIDKSEKKEVRKDMGIPENAFVLGRIGRPDLNKWSPVIFNMYFNLAKDNKNIYMVLVGAPRKYENMVSKFPRAIRSRIIFMPSVNDDSKLRKLYGIFDVFLHVSRIGESFGLVLCESMLCGVPVITLATPLKDNSQMEVVGHKSGGLVILNNRHIAEAIEYLVANRDQLELMSMQSRKMIIERYDKQIVIRKLVTIANALVDANSSEDLRDTLEAIGFQTSSNWNELNRELNRGIGHVPCHTYWELTLLHTPIIYKIWIGIKHNWKRKINVGVTGGYGRV